MRDRQTLSQEDRVTEKHCGEREKQGEKRKATKKIRGQKRW